MLSTKTSLLNSIFISGNFQNVLLSTNMPYDKKWGISRQNLEKPFSMMIPKEIYRSNSIQKYFFVGTQVLLILRKTTHQYHGIV